ncbi:hypothetical protein [Tateyamaria sp.]|uniref:hypothetical protein n=1 Tax=Tateyamaria sp. TaxID=1929288 RepID=UPI00329DB8FB
MTLANPFKPAAPAKAASPALTEQIVKDLGVAVGQALAEEINPLKQRIDALEAALAVEQSRAAGELEGAVERFLEGGQHG